MVIHIHRRSDNAPISRLGHLATVGGAVFGSHELFLVTVDDAIAGWAPVSSNHSTWSTLSFSRRHCLVLPRSVVMREFLDIGTSI